MWYHSCENGYDIGWIDTSYEGEISTKISKGTNILALKPGLYEFEDSSATEEDMLSMGFPIYSWHSLIRISGSWSTEYVQGYIKIDFLSMTDNISYTRSLGWETWGNWKLNIDSSNANFLPLTGGTIIGDTHFHSNVFFSGNSDNMEGGKITFSKPPSVDSFNNDITLDIYGHCARFFSLYDNIIKVFNIDFSTHPGGDVFVYHTGNIKSGSSTVPSDLQNNGIYLKYS